MNIPESIVVMDASSSPCRATVAEIAQRLINGDSIFDACGIRNRYVSTGANETTLFFEPAGRLAAIAAALRAGEFDRSFDVSSHDESSEIE